MSQQPTLEQALQAAATTTDQNVRTQVEAFLKAQEKADFPLYIRSLVIELGTATRTKDVRQLAGLQLKNTMEARDEQAAKMLAERWKSVPQQKRDEVKTMLLQILCDPEKSVRSTATLVIKTIAAIEIPLGTWPNLIGALDANIRQTANVGLRQASLEALGYVCEEVPQSMAPHSSIILAAIASGMDNSQSAEVKLTATTCLLNSMEFIRGNMELERDRGVIMSMVFAMEQCQDDEQVRVRAYQCLCQIADSYYDYIGPSMNVIFERTIKAISTPDQEDISKQAVELWCTLCDVELEIEDEETQAPPQKSRNQHIIPAAVQHLVPTLLSVLTQQSETPEDDDYTLSLASATCIGLCSQVAKNGIVGCVLPYVNTNINSANWREREAAILAFGCILEGPNKEEMAKLVRTAFETILTKMADLPNPHPMVKDTAAWTVGRICGLLPEVIDEHSLPKLMHAVQGALLDPSPKIASNSAWAIHNLASAVAVDGDTSPLSPYFESLLKALFACSVRPDVKTSNLQTSVFEAINALVSSAAPDVEKVIEMALPYLYKVLGQKVVQRSESAADKEELNEIQALLCGTLQAIVTQLPPEVVVPHLNPLMDILLHVLGANNSVVQEEALMAIGAIADTVTDAFLPWADRVKPHILRALQNAQEFHACKNAITTTGDISRALKANFFKWGADEVMGQLLVHLDNPSIERMLKVHMIECIGDIASAVGPIFADRYMQHVLPMLITASGFEYKKEDWINQEYVQQLREAVLTCYLGIIGGLTADPNNNKIAQFVNFKGVIESICSLITIIVKDDFSNRSEAVLRTACGLVYDLVEFAGLKQAMAIEPVRQLWILAKNEQMYSQETNNMGLNLEAAFKQ